MITEDYVSFDTAKLLKEKGFDQPCTMSFFDEDSYREWIETAPRPLHLDDESGRPFTYQRPTLQMAMKWLREVHHCVICITPLTFYCGEIVSKWGYCIWADDNTEVDEESSPRLESYEEVCEAAIKYCLENLI